jgi:hypothetical protein
MPATLSRNVILILRQRTAGEQELSGLIQKGRICSGRPTLPSDTGLNEEEY